MGERTVTMRGEGILELKLDHLRQLALMQAPLRFSHVAARDILATLHSISAKTLSGEANPGQQDSAISTSLISGVTTALNY